MEGMFFYFQNGEIWVTMPSIPTTTVVASGSSSIGVTSFSLSAHLRSLMADAFVESGVGQQPVPVEIDPRNTSW